MEQELAQAQGDLAYAAGRIDLVLARMSTLLALPADEVDPLELQMVMDELALSRTIWSAAEDRIAELARTIKGQRTAGSGG